jgi:hypothetical protein
MKVEKRLINIGAFPIVGYRWDTSMGSDASLPILELLQSRRVQIFSGGAECRDHAQLFGPAA